MKNFFCFRSSGFCREIKNPPPQSLIVKGENGLSDRADHNLRSPKGLELVLLREKLHFKELEVERLQAELATTVRGKDILLCEIQNALDSLSIASFNKMRELELQKRNKLRDSTMFDLQSLEKDENINRIQMDLQQSAKELTRIEGILSKVLDERDFMFKEVEQYSEQNMLMNSEISALKKRIEELDEDVLFKDGQISILKDSLRKKPFYLLGSPDSAYE